MGVSLNQLVNMTKKVKNYIDKDITQLEGADFVTDNGFGGLRVKDGVYQYYNTDLSKWIDVQVTDGNLYVSNCIPNPVETLSVMYDSSLTRFKLKLEEPADTIVNGTTLFTVEGVKIIRKEGSAPTSVDDGVLVADIPRRKFGSYKDTWLVDEKSVVIGTVYYYKAFSYNNLGIYNQDGISVTASHTKEIYSFRLNQSESNPASMITYIGANENYIPAKMNFETGVFNYGDWGNAWFITGCKPCMLKYDGTVDYYLDPNDYTKKEDGTASDVANTAYEGNVMIEFPKTYMKLVPNESDENILDVYVSNTKVDDEYTCWSFINSIGEEIETCYLPAYDGSIVDNKLRSISGLVPSKSTAYTTELECAINNNASSDVMWYSEVYSDRMMILMLLLLIAKTPDSASAFGAGNCSGEESSIANTGVCNTNGLFYGKSSSYCAKVFGMENWYGNTWRKTAGHLAYHHAQKIKMTYGTQDGSTAEGYNLTGEGYIDSYTLTSQIVGHLDKMVFSKNGIVPKSGNGSSTTYYKALVYSNPNIIGIGQYGGCITSTGSSMMSVALSDSASTIYYWSGCSISCKPIKK